MLSLPPRRFARQAVRSAAFTAVIGPHVLTISVSGTLLGRALIAITHRPFSDVLGILVGFEGRPPVAKRSQQQAKSRYRPSCGVDGNDSRRIAIRCLQAAVHRRYTCV